jgi:thiamine-phosphate pyrophosphorylase
VSMNKLSRLVDANLNRVREGLRVCEDIARFILDDTRITRSFKALRHSVSALAERMNKKKLVLLASRDVRRDIGKSTSVREGRRKDLGDIFAANIQRSKESLRVLEETTKLVNAGISRDFKKIRFRVYALEKKTRIKVEGVLHR